MADTVTTQTLADGPKTAVLKLTNISDGSGESAVTKVDVSALQPSADGDTCTRGDHRKDLVAVHRHESTNPVGCHTDLFCIELGENQSGDHDYTKFGGLTNNAGSERRGPQIYHRWS